MKVIDNIKIPANSVEEQTANESVLIEMSSNSAQLIFDHLQTLPPASDFGYERLWVRDSYGSLAYVGGNPGQWIFFASVPSKSTAI